MDHVKRENRAQSGFYLDLFFWSKVKIYSYNDEEVYR